MAKAKKEQPGEGRVGGMEVSKTPYQDPKRIKIVEGTSVVFKDEPYSGGDTLTVEGPTADAMVMNGYAEYDEE